MGHAKGLRASLGRDVRAGVVSASPFRVPVARA